MLRTVSCTLVLLASLSVSCSSPSRPIALGALLSGADAPGYTQTVAAGRCDFPGTGVTQPLPFAECEATGFTTDAALSGAGRSQIDAMTRLEGNDPSVLNGPELPIKGPFVATHHGVFEIYLRVVVLPDAVAAILAFGEFSRADPISQIDWRNGDTNAVGEVSITKRGLLGLDPTMYETAVVTRWRRGNVIGELSTLGAADLESSANLTLARIVDERIARNLK